MTDDFATKYPEHAKLEARKAEQEIIDDFLHWLDDKNIHLCEWDYDEDAYTPNSGWGYANILADYFGIDRNKFSAEKDRMLEEYREAVASKEIVFVGVKEETDGGAAEEDL